MNRWVWAAVALGVLAMSGARAVAADEQAALLHDGKALAAAMGKEDCKAGLPIARRMTDNAALSDSANEVQTAAWAARAMCAAKQNQTEEAFEASRRATNLPNASDWVWTFRIEAGVSLDRPDDVAEAVTTLAQVKPAVLSTIPVGLFYRLERRDPQGSGSRVFQRVAAALESADYHPPSPVDSADYLWLDYAESVADSGETAHAAALLGRLTTTRVLMLAKLDGRFAAAVSARPEQFDLKANAERQLERDRAVAAAHPELLEAVFLVTSDLRALGRYDEALALTESTLARAQHGEAGKLAFADQASQLNWIEDQRARLLFELGRTDEALEMERTAARLGEAGQPNVSQVINLAGDLIEAERPEEALKTVATFGDNAARTNPYGAGWVHEVRACADQALGRTAELASEMGYLAAHAADNPDARLGALLCANDLDGAAAELIARLQDPRRREQTLVDLSQFNPPQHPLPLVATWMARLDAIGARADVRDAVAKVGRTEVVPLESVYSNVF